MNWTWILRPKTLYLICYDSPPPESVLRQITNHRSQYFIRFMEAVGKAAERRMYWECDGQKYGRN